MKSFLEMQEDGIPEEGRRRGMGMKDSSVPLLP